MLTTIIKPMNKKLLTFYITASILITACGVPKKLMQKIESSKKENIDFPLEYANLFPTPTFKQWDNDYNYYERFLTQDILKTQIGLSYFNNGVQTWFCMPSARTHVQLDTTTMIFNKKLVVGNWRSVCNRRVSFIDSVVYDNKKIYRKSKLVKNETKADAFLSITDTKFKLYGADRVGDKFKRVVSKNYDIQSKRFLLLYGLFKASAAVSFVGIDKEGRLIINSYYVQERKKDGIYITYEAVMSQLIYKRQD
jgi:hypothetical protein